MMVEILCGVMSDAKFGNNIRSWKINDRIADLVCKVVVWSSVDDNGENDDMSVLIKEWYMYIYIYIH